jgi:tRNA nucleotidyltransferase (CCA-adding enzyme)
LHQNGFLAYLVGGAVRDLLLGRPIKDWDVATNARPENVIPLFERVIPTGIAHGTVTVLMGKLKIEVTTFRGEGTYTDGRHPDHVEFLDSLEEDLRRRDFTINAMAYDLLTKRIIDPYGGSADLSAGLVRAVGNPIERFLEDGLRPLRAVRFSCVLDFAIEAATMAGIGAALPVFRQVANERVRDELLKILSSRHAARGIEALRQTGLLGEILPELLPTIGQAQNSFHKHDVYHHSLECLAHGRGDGVLKLAILLHDCGKPQSAGGPSGEHTFYNHERLSALGADEAMQRLRFSHDERERVSTLIANHMFNYEPSWTDGAVRRLVRKVGLERLSDLWELRRADILGRGMMVRGALDNLNLLKKRVEEIISKDSALKIKDLAINGETVMRELGLVPGPEVGRILDSLLEKVLDDPKINNEIDLKRILKELA